jgi:hydrogenase expression/formation protein HypD
VRWEGNTKAQELIREVFDVKDGKWRGLGIIPSSKLALKERYATYDAELKYTVTAEEGIDSQPGCRCHLVIIGKIKPTACPLFMKACTPQNPVGACMVSMEGTCRVWAKTVGS